MTAERFKQKIKSAYKVDNTLNYIICYFFIAAGVFSLFFIFNEGLLTFPELGQYLVFIGPLIFFSAGFYGLWRIPKDYTVRQLDSSKPILEKENAICSYIGQYKVVWKLVEGTYISVRYRNKFYTHIDARFYYDDSTILFNAEGADLSGTKGIIDFGIGKRAMNKIQQHLEACL